jgi:hypothetical protein
MSMCTSSPGRSALVVVLWPLAQPAELAYADPLEDPADR